MEKSEHAAMRIAARRVLRLNRMRDAELFALQRLTPGEQEAVRVEAVRMKINGEIGDQQMSDEPGRNASADTENVRVLTECYLRLRSCGAGEYDLKDLMNAINSTAKLIAADAAMAFQDQNGKPA